MCRHLVVRYCDRLITICIWTLQTQRKRETRECYATRRNKSDRIAPTKRIVDRRANSIIRVSNKELCCMKLIRVPNKTTSTRWRRGAIALHHPTNHKLMIFLRNLLKTSAFGETRADLSPAIGYVLVGLVGRTRFCVCHINKVFPAPHLTPDAANQIKISKEHHHHHHYQHRQHQSSRLHLMVGAQLLIFRGNSPDSWR